MKTAAGKAASRSGPGAAGVLVAPQWLEDHLGDPRVRVVEVDVSPAAYQDWHVDGAVLWNIYGDLKDADYQLAGAAALEQLVARSGIGPDSAVVFYAQRPGRASRPGEHTSTTGGGRRGGWHHEPGRAVAEPPGLPWAM